MRYVPILGAVTLFLYFVLTVRDFKINDEAAGARLKRNFLAAHILKERQQTQMKVKAVMLNTYRPSFEGLAQFMNDPQSFDKNNFREYRQYYQRVVEYFPALAEGHVMLGVCDYYLGKGDLAVESFKKGLSINPELLWLNYNLGAVAFNQGNFSQAASFFFKVISGHPRDTLKYLSTSQVYRQILAGSKISNQALTEKLKTDYRDSFRYLALSFYHLKIFPDMFKISLQAVERQMDNDGEFYFYAGVAAFEMKQYAQAVSLFQEALKYNTDAQTYQYLAKALKSLGREDAASTFLQKSVALEKSNGIKDFRQVRAELKIF